MSGPIMALIGIVAGSYPADVVTISDQIKTGLGSGGACSAGVKLGRNGKYYGGDHASSTTPTYADVGGVEWIDNEAVDAGDAYECRMVTGTGTVSTGTTDSWLAMTSDREWTVSVVSAGSKFFTGTLQIRKTGVIVDTAEISLNAISV